MYYLKNRYYSPALGRFLTKDSYGFINPRNPQTLNLYTYAGNNPVSNVDPNGNYVWETDHDLPIDKQIEIIKATIDYYNATTDAEREAAHNRAEAIRNSVPAEDHHSNSGYLTATFSKSGVFASITVDLDSGDVGYNIGLGSFGSPTITYSPGEATPGTYLFGEFYFPVGGQVNYNMATKSFGGSGGAGVAGGAGVYKQNSFLNTFNKILKWLTTRSNRR